MSTVLHNPLGVSRSFLSAPLPVIQARLQQEAFITPLLFVRSISRALRARVYRERTEHLILGKKPRLLGRPLINFNNWPATSGLVMVPYRMSAPQMVLYSGVLTVIGLAGWWVVRRLIKPLIAQSLRKSDPKSLARMNALNRSTGQIRYSELARGLLALERMATLPEKIHLLSWVLHVAYEQRFVDTSLERVRDMWKPIWSLGNDWRLRDHLNYCSTQIATGVVMILFRNGWQEDLSPVWDLTFKLSTYKGLFGGDKTDPALLQTLGKTQGVSHRYFADRFSQFIREEQHPLWPLMNYESVLPVLVELGWDLDTQSAWDAILRRGGISRILLSLRYLLKIPNVPSFYTALWVVRFFESGLYDNEPLDRLGGWIIQALLSKPGAWSADAIEAILSALRKNKLPADDIETLGRKLESRTSPRNARLLWRRLIPNFVRRRLDREERSPDLSIKREEDVQQVPGAEMSTQDHVESPVSEVPAIENGIPVPVDIFTEKLEQLRKIGWHYRSFGNYGPTIRDHGIDNVIQWTTGKRNAEQEGIRASQELLDYADEERVSIRPDGIVDLNKGDIILDKSSDLWTIYEFQEENPDSYVARQSLPGYSIHLTDLRIATETRPQPDKFKESIHSGKVVRLVPRQQENPVQGLPLSLADERDNTQPHNSDFENALRKLGAKEQELKQLNEGIRFHPYFVVPEPTDERLFSHVRKKEQAEADYEHLIGELLENAISVPIHFDGLGIPQIKPGDVIYFANTNEVHRYRAFIPDTRGRSGLPAGAGLSFKEIDASSLSTDGQASGTGSIDVVVMLSNFREEAEAGHMVKLLPKTKPPSEQGEGNKSRLSIVLAWFGSLFYGGMIASAGVHWHLQWWFVWTTLAVLAGWEMMFFKQFAATLKLKSSILGKKMADGTIWVNPHLSPFMQRWIYWHEKWVHALPGGGLNDFLFAPFVDPLAFLVAKADSLQPFLMRMHKPEPLRNIPSNPVLPISVIQSRFNDAHESNLASEGYGARDVAVRSTVHQSIRRPITLYYPGAGKDLGHPLKLFDPDILLFVDLQRLSFESVYAMVEESADSILSAQLLSNGTIHVCFLYNKRIKDLYYFVGVNAAREDQLPKEVKKGFDIYFDNLLRNGYGWRPDPGIFPLATKYMKLGGFYLSEVPPYEDDTREVLDPRFNKIADGAFSLYYFSEEQSDIPTMPAAEMMESSNRNLSPKPDVHKHLLQSQA